MTGERNLLLRDTAIETWNEELARAKKYKEAMQKRKTEKLVSKQIEKLKKASLVGRLKIEP
ncbi:hypothetical protein [Flavisolibacter ginsenosidimutans]|uniref:Uncharacterized protein n=1 Tax=Flavisolibacter ginsenosidimutans TaxID=661481 RepID=A0A5B8UNN9_9BACT|nr:hypothetical protein [Flavisolibacter ginsenosidimutans]QEC57555.1 hypothetical protein FSB75_17145 [Flavisolibacter ginsenosidimutans]